MTTTNTDRARRASDVLVRYNVENQGGDRDIYTAAIDLLADIRHLADKEGWVFDWIAESAAMHHDEEVADEARDAAEAAAHARRIDP